MTLRLAVIWAVLAALLGFALGGTVVDWSLTRPLYVQKQPDSQSQNKGTAKNNDPSAFFAVGAWAKDNAAAIGALSAIGVLAFTVVLAVSTILLWDATKKLWSASENTAQRQLRAYVSIDPKLILNWSAPPAGISFNIENHGQTVGSNVTYDYAFAVLDHPLPDEFVFPIPDRRYEQNNSLFPRTTVPVRVIAPFSLTPLGRNDVESGAARFHMWGVMHYFDAFNDKRTTKFSFSCGGPNFGASVNGTPTDWQWEHGHGHNDAT